MKTIIHKANSRGHADHGWLQANHSFSFANYFDKEKVQFGALRVLNDDRLAPKMGFGTHPHANMEIITIPLSGILKHRDNIHQDWQQIIPGEVQVMSAGTGVEHSEINGSEEESLSLFQIWILPNEQNVEPRYGQKMFDKLDRKNKLQTLVSSINDKDQGSLKIHQNARISRIDLDSDHTFEYQLLNKKNGVYIMNIFGKYVIDEYILESRDAIAISEAEKFTVNSKIDSSILFIEVPME